MTFQRQVRCTQCKGVFPSNEWKWPVTIPARRQCQPDLRTEEETVTQCPGCGETECAEELDSSPCLGPHATDSRQGRETTPGAGRESET